MTISSIGFQNAAIHIAGSSATSSATSSSDSSSSSKSDSVTLSAQSQALFQQSQGASGQHHHHHPALTDDQAAKVGDQISQKDPALFKQLDKDGDGKLSAGELKDGIKQLREQQQSATSSTGDAASTGTSSDDDVSDELDTIKQAFDAVLGHGKHPGPPPEAPPSDATASDVSASST